MQDGFLVVDPTVCVDDLGSDARNSILRENKDVVLACLWSYAGGISFFYVLGPSTQSILDNIQNGSVVRTLNVFTELDKVLSVECLEHCLLQKYEAPTRMA